MSSVRYRIGVGQLNDDINAVQPTVQLTPFTAASTDIFANTVNRYANETN